MLVESEMHFVTKDRSKDPFLRCSISLPFLYFVFLYDSAFLLFLSPRFQQGSPKLLPRSHCLKYRTRDVRKQDAVPMDIQATKQGWCASLKRPSNEQNIAHQTREQKKCFKLFDYSVAQVQ